MGYGRFPQPAEPQAGQRNAELADRKIRIQMVYAKKRQFGLLVIPLDQEFQLRSADFNKRKFRRNKKAVEKHQQQGQSEHSDIIHGYTPEMVSLWNKELPYPYSAVISTEILLKYMFPSQAFSSRIDSPEKSDRLFFCAKAGNDRFFALRPADIRRHIGLVVSLRLQRV